VAIVLVVAGCAEHITTPLKAGTEVAVLAELRNLHIAQTQYMMKNQRFGTLAELKAAKLIDDAVASGRLHGYVLTEVSVGSKDYAFRAAPDGENKLNTRHFYLDQTGTVREAEKRPAGPNDALNRGM
jgi:hypothetical protein